MEEKVRLEAEAVAAEMKAAKEAEETAKALTDHDVPGEKVAGCANKYIRFRLARKPQHIQRLAQPHQHRQAFAEVLGDAQRVCVCVECWPHLPPLHGSALTRVWGSQCPGDYYEPLLVTPKRFILYNILDLDA